MRPKTLVIRVTLNLKAQLAGPRPKNHMSVTWSDRSKYEPIPALLINEYSIEHQHNLRHVLYLDLIIHDENPITPISVISLKRSSLLCTLFLPLKGLSKLHFRRTNLAFLSSYLCCVWIEGIEWMWE